MDASMNAFTSNVRQELSESKTTLRKEESRNTSQFLTLKEKEEDDDEREDERGR
jgi:hypothetical protein